MDKKPLEELAQVEQEEKQVKSILMKEEVTNGNKVNNANLSNKNVSFNFFITDKASDKKKSCNFFNLVIDIIMSNV